MRTPTNGENSVTKLQKGKSNLKHIGIEDSKIFRTVFGCRWTSRIFSLLGTGKQRPSKILKMFRGLSSKTLSDRLKKLIDLGLVERDVSAKMPIEVYYKLTSKGRHVFKLVQKILNLEIK